MEPVRDAPLFAPTVTETEVVPEPPLTGLMVRKPSLLDSSQGSVDSTAIVNESPEAGLVADCGDMVKPVTGCTPPPSCNTVMLFRNSL